MDYLKAQEYSLSVRWKTSYCSEGEQCWCRIIEPEEIIHDKDGHEIYIASSGTIPKI